MSTAPQAQPPSTTQPEYTERLRREGGHIWKRVLDVQAPYRWNVRRHAVGLTLDLGCGIGRNLAHLKGRAVGVDHNSESIAECRRRGLEAYLPTEFFASQRAQPRSFGTLLLAHVVEHLTVDEADKLVRPYLPFLGDPGRLIIITPQEAGFMSDATHVEFMDHKRNAALLDRLGFTVEAEHSFPFPRRLGPFFKYNEFVTIGRRRAQ